MSTVKASTRNVTPDELAELVITGAISLLDQTPQVILVAIPEQKLEKGAVIVSDGTSWFDTGAKIV